MRPQAFLKLKREKVAFERREQRSLFLLKRYRRFLKGRILDVGCDRGWLRQLLGESYVGVDRRGLPDVQIDLEKVSFLPFPDDSFDCVLCMDVLEHLDNLHYVFEEIVRVCRRYLILSLPNNWANARRPIARGRGSIGHYGLPPEPPQDRHKWFFNFSEALAFLKAQGEKYHLHEVEILALEKPRPWPIRAVRRVLWPSLERYLNRYAHSLWVVFEKER
ncbi:MAG: hypothetical protein DRG69_01280 [Deltaproteobacteria bacterium]|nr:MAG: hypothetical protein DRG69_01280 [Deltaproteobacteria bacterium]